MTFCLVGWIFLRGGGGKIEKSLGAFAMVPRSCFSITNFYFLKKFSEFIPHSVNTSPILFLPFSNSTGLFSMSIKSLLVFMQASPVVPLPLVLSSTVSPGSLYVFIISSISNTGFCVACRGFFCYLLQTSIRFLGIAQYYYTL